MRKLLISIGIFVVMLACLFATSASAPAQQGKVINDDISDAIEAIKQFSYQHPKWEYKIIRQEDTTDATELNKLGADGWKLSELQTILNAGNTRHTNLIFERRLIQGQEVGPEPPPYPMSENN